MKRLVLLSMVLVIVACTSGDRIAGGTGTETSTGTVAMVQGKPAAGAVVRLVDRDAWLTRAFGDCTVVLDSTIAGSDGRFSFAAAPEGGYNLQIDHRDGGVLIDQSALERDTIELRRYSTFRGSLAASSSTPAALLFAGSAYSATPSTSGEYVVPHVAPGAYPVLGSYRTGAGASLAYIGLRSMEESAPVTETNIVADTSTVPLDGFSGAFGLTELGYLIGGTWWYHFSDTAAGEYDPVTGEWHLSPDFPDSSTTVILPRLSYDGGTGKTLSATVVLGTSKEVTAAGIGVYFGKREADGFDLSDLRSFTFMARGVGTIRVRFESKILDTVDANEQYTHFVTLAPTWQRVSVDPALLNLNPLNDELQAAIPWNTAARQISRIEFEYLSAHNPKGDSLWIELDDLVFKGSDLRQLAGNP